MGFSRETIIALVLTAALSCALPSLAQAPNKSNLDHTSPTPATPRWNLKQWSDINSDEAIPFVVITEPGVQPADVAHFLRHNELLYRKAMDVVSKDGLTLRDLKRLHLDVFYEALRGSAFPEITPDTRDTAKIGKATIDALKQMLRGIYLYSVTTAIDAPKVKRTLPLDVLALAHEMFLSPGDRKREMEHVVGRLEGMAAPRETTVRSLPKLVLEAIAKEVRDLPESEKVTRDLLSGPLRTWIQSGFSALTPADTALLSELALSLPAAREAQISLGTVLHAILVQNLHDSPARTGAGFTDLRAHEREWRNKRGLLDASEVRWQWPANYSSAQPSMKKNAETLLGALAQIESGHLDRLANYYELKFGSRLTDSSEVAKKSLTQALLSDYLSRYEYTRTRFGTSLPLNIHLLADRAAASRDGKKLTEFPRFVAALKDRYGYQSPFDEVEKALKTPEGRAELLEKLKKYKFQPLLADSLGLVRAMIQEHGADPNAVGGAHPTDRYLASKARVHFDPLGAKLPEEVASVEKRECPEPMPQEQAERWLKSSEIKLIKARPEDPLSRKIAVARQNTALAYRALVAWKNLGKSAAGMDDKFYTAEEALAEAFADQFETMTKGEPTEALLAYPAETLLLLDRFDRLSNHHGSYRFLAKAILTMEAYRGENATVAANAKAIAKALRDLYESPSATTSRPSGFRSVEEKADIVMRECASSKSCPASVVDTAALLKTLAEDSWGPLFPFGNERDATRGSSKGFSLYRDYGDMEYLPACRLEKSRITPGNGPAFMLASMPSSPSVETATAILSENRAKIQSVLEDLAQGRWTGALNDLHQKVVGLPLPSDPARWQKEAKQKIIEKLFADYLEQFEKARSVLGSSRMLALPADVLLLRDRAAKDDKYTYFMGRVRQELGRAKVNVPNGALENFPASAEARRALADLSETVDHADLDPILALLQTVLQDYGSHDGDRPDHVFPRGNEARYVLGRYAPSRQGPPETSWLSPKESPPSFMREGNFPFFRLHSDWTRQQALRALNANAKLVFEGMELAEKWIDEAGDSRSASSKSCGKLWDTFIVPLKVGDPSIINDFPATKDRFCFELQMNVGRVNRIGKDHWKVDFRRGVQGAIARRLLEGFGRFWGEVVKDQGAGAEGYFLDNVSSDAFAAYYLSQGNRDGRALSRRFAQVAARIASPGLLQRFLDDTSAGKDAENFFTGMSDDQRRQWALENYRTVAYYHPELGRLIQLSLVERHDSAVPGKPELPTKALDRISLDRDFRLELLDPRKGHDYLLDLEFLDRTNRGLKPFVTVNEVIAGADAFLAKRGKRLPDGVKRQIKKWSESIDSESGRLLPGLEIQTMQRMIDLMAKHTPEELEALLSDKTNFSDAFRKAASRWGSYSYPVDPFVSNGGEDQKTIADQADWAMRWVRSGKATPGELAQVFDDYYRARTGWPLSEELRTLGVDLNGPVHEVDTKRLLRLLLEDKLGLSAFFHYDTPADAMDRARLALGGRPSAPECERFVRVAQARADQRTALISALASFNEATFWGTDRIGNEAFERLVSVIRQIPDPAAGIFNASPYSEANARKVGALYIAIQNFNRTRNKADIQSALTSHIRTGISFDQFLTRFLGGDPPKVPPFGFRGKVTQEKLPLFKKAVDDQIRKAFPSLDDSGRGALVQLFTDLSASWPRFPGRMNRQDSPEAYLAFESEFNRLKISLPASPDDLWIRKMVHWLDGRYLDTSGIGSLVEGQSPLWESERKKLKESGLQLSDADLHLLRTASQLNRLISAFRPRRNAGRSGGATAPDYLKLRREELEGDYARLIGQKLTPDDPRCRAAAAEKYGPIQMRHNVEQALINEIIDPPAYDRPNVDVGRMVRNIMNVGTYFEGHSPSVIRPQDVPEPVRSYVQSVVCADNDEARDKELQKRFDVVAGQSSAPGKLLAYRSFLLEELRDLDEEMKRGDKRAFDRYQLRCARGRTEKLDSLSLALANILRETERKLHGDSNFVTPDLAAQRTEDPEGKRFNVPVRTYRERARKVIAQGIPVVNTTLYVHEFWMDRQGECLPGLRVSLDKLPPRMADYLSSTACAAPDARLSLLREPIDIQASNPNYSMRVMKGFRAFLLRELSLVRELKSKDPRRIPELFGLACLRNRNLGDGVEAVSLALSHLVHEVDRSLWSNRAYTLRVKLPGAPETEDPLGPIDQSFRSQGIASDYRDLLYKEMEKLPPAFCPDGRWPFSGPEAAPHVAVNGDFIDWIERLLNAAPFQTGLSTSARAGLLQLSPAVRRVLTTLLSDVYRRAVNGDMDARSHRILVLALNPDPIRILQEAVRRDSQTGGPLGSYSRAVLSSAMREALRETANDTVEFFARGERGSALTKLADDFASLSDSTSFEGKEAFRARLLWWIRDLDRTKDARAAEVLQHLTLMYQALDEGGHWAEGAKDPAYGERYESSRDGMNRLKPESVLKAADAEQAALTSLGCSRDGVMVRLATLLATYNSPWLPTTPKPAACTKLDQYVRLLHAEGKGMDAEARTKFLQTNFTDGELSAIDRLTEITKHMLDPTGAREVKKQLHLFLSAPSKEALEILGYFADDDFRSFEKLVHARHSALNGITLELARLAEADQYALNDGLYRLKIDAKLANRIDTLARTISLALAVERANRTKASGNKIKEWADELYRGKDGEKGVLEKLSDTLRRDASRLLLERAAARTGAGQPIEQKNLLAAVGYREPGKNDDPSKPEFQLYRRLRSLVDGLVSPDKMEKKAEADLRLKLSAEKGLKPKELFERKLAELKALVDEKTNDAKKRIESNAAARGERLPANWEVLGAKDPEVVAVKSEMERFKGRGAEEYAKQHAALVAESETGGPAFKAAVRAQVKTNATELVHDELKALVGHPDDPSSIPREALFKKFLRTNLKSCVEELFDKEAEAKPKELVEDEKRLKAIETAFADLQKQAREKREDAMAKRQEADSLRDKAGELKEQAARKRHFAEDKDYQSHWLGKVYAWKATQLEKEAGEKTAKSQAFAAAAARAESAAAELEQKLRQEKLKLLQLQAKVIAMHPGLPQVNEWRLPPELEMAMDQWGEEGKRISRLSSQDLVEKARLKQLVPSLLNRVKFFESQMKQQKEYLDSHSELLRDMNKQDREKAEAPYRYYSAMYHDAQIELETVNAELEVLSDNEPMGVKESEVHARVNKEIEAWFDREMTALRRKNDPGFVPESKIRELLSDPKFFNPIREALADRYKGMEDQVRDYCRAAAEKHDTSIDQDECQRKQDTFAFFYARAKYAQAGDPTSTPALRLRQMIHQIEQRKLGEWLRDRGNELRRLAETDRQKQESLQERTYNEKARACLDHLAAKGIKPPVTIDEDNGWNEMDLQQTAEALKKVRQLDQDAEKLAVAVLPPVSAKQDILQGEGKSELDRVMNHPTARGAYRDLLQAYNPPDGDFAFSPEDARKRVEHAFNREAPRRRADSKELEDILKQLTPLGFEWDGQKLDWTKARLWELGKQKNLKLSKLKELMQQLGKFGQYRLDGTNPWQVMTAELLAMYVKGSMTPTLRFYRNSVVFNKNLYGAHGHLITTAHTIDPTALDRFITFEDPKETQREAQETSARLEKNLKQYQEIQKKIPEVSSSWSSFFESAKDLFQWCSDPVEQLEKNPNLADSPEELCGKGIYGTPIGGGVSANAKEMLRQKRLLEQKIGVEIRKLHGFGDVEVKHRFASQVEENGRKKDVVTHQDVAAKDLAGMFDYQHHYLRLDQGARLTAEAFKAYQASQEFITEWVATEAATAALDVATLGASRAARLAFQVAKGAQFSYRVSAGTKVFFDTLDYFQSDPDKRNNMSWVQTRGQARHQAALFGGLPVVSQGLGFLPAILRGPFSMFLMSEGTGVVTALANGESLDGINWAELHRQSALSAVYGANINGGVASIGRRIPIVRNNAVARRLFGMAGNYAGFRGLSSIISVIETLQKGYIVDRKTGEVYKDPRIGEIADSLLEDLKHSLVLELTFTVHGGREISQQMAKGMILSEGLSPREVAQAMVGPRPEPRVGETRSAYEARLERHMEKTNELLSHAFAELDTKGINKYIELDTKERLRAPLQGGVLEIDTETGLRKPASSEATQATRVLVELARQAGFAPEGKVSERDLRDFRDAYEAAKGSNPFLSWGNILPKVQTRGRSALKARLDGGKLTLADYFSHPLIASGQRDAQLETKASDLVEALKKPADSPDRIAAETYVAQVLRRVYNGDTARPETRAGRLIARLFKGKQITAEGLRLLVEVSGEVPNESVFTLVSRLKALARSGQAIAK